MVGRIFQGCENGVSLSYAFATTCLNPAFATGLSPGRHMDRGGGYKATGFGNRSSLAAQITNVL